MRDSGKASKQASEGKQQSEGSECGWVKIRELGTQCRARARAEPWHSDVEHRSPNQQLNHWAKRLPPGHLKSILDPMRKKGNQLPMSKYIDIKKKKKV